MSKSPQTIPRPQSGHKETPQAYPDLPKPNLRRQESGRSRSSKKPKNLPLTPKKHVTSTPKSELVKNLRHSHQASIPRPKNTTPKPKKIKEKKRLTLNLEDPNQSKFMKKHVLVFKSNFYKLVGSLNVIDQIFLSLHDLEIPQSDKKYDTIMDKVLGKFSQVFENFIVDLFFSDHFQLIERVHGICFHKGDVNFKQLVSKQIKNVMASDFREIFLKKEEEEKKKKKEKVSEIKRQSVRSCKSKAAESTAPVDPSTRRTPSKRGSRIGPADQIREAIFAARKENLKRGSYNGPKRACDNDGLFSQEIKIPKCVEKEEETGCARELTESYYSMAEEEPKELNAREREKTASPKKRPGKAQDRQDIENKIDKFPEMRNIGKKKQPNVEIRKKLDFDHDEIRRQSTQGIDIEREREKLQKELERERQEMQRLQREKIERERIKRENIEKEKLRLKKELEREKLEMERLQREKQEREKKERLEREMKERQEREKKDRIEREKKERLEMERKREIITRERELAERKKQERYKEEESNRRSRSIRRPSHIPNDNIEESYFRTKRTSYKNSVTKQPEFTPRKSSGSCQRVEEMKEKLSALVNKKTPKAPRNCARFSPAPSKKGKQSQEAISHHHKMINDLIALPDHLQGIGNQSKKNSGQKSSYHKRKEELKKYEKPTEEDEDENLIRVDVQANHHNKKIMSLIEKKKNKLRSPYGGIKSPYKDQTMGIPESIKGSPEYNKADSFAHSGINLLKYGSEFVTSELEKTPDKPKPRDKKRKGKNVKDWNSIINEKQEDELTLGNKSIVEPHKGFVEDMNNNGGNSFVSPNKSMKSYLEENDMRNFGKENEKNRRSEENKENEKDFRVDFPIDDESRKSSLGVGVYGSPKRRKRNKIPEHTYRSDSMAEEDKIQVRKTKTKIVEDLIESFTKEVEMEILGQTEEQRVQISFTDKEIAVKQKYQDDFDDINKFSFLPKNMDRNYLKSPNEKRESKRRSIDKTTPLGNYEKKNNSRRPSKNSNISPLRGWRENSQNKTPGRKENIREKISIMGKTSTNPSNRPYQFNHQKEKNSGIGYEKSKISAKLNSNNRGRSPYSGTNVGNSIAGRSTYSRNLSNIVPGLKNLTGGYGNSSRYSNYSNIYNPSSITARHSRNRTLDENNLSSYRAGSSYKKPDPMKYRIVNGKVEYLNK